MTSDTVPTKASVVAAPFASAWNVPGTIQGSDPGSRSSERQPPRGQLLLQLLGYRRCRTAEPQDRLGERSDHDVHTRVLPVPLPPVGSEIPAYQRIVVHGHRASMPPMNLVAPPDRIEIKGTGRCDFPDARCPEQTTIGDHHVRPCCARAVEITRRRDVCAPAGGEDLLATNRWLRAAASLSFIRSRR